MGPKLFEVAFKYVLLKLVIVTFWFIASKSKK